MHRLPVSIAALSSPGLLARVVMHAGDTVAAPGGVTSPGAGNRSTLRPTACLPEDAPASLDKQRLSHQSLRVNSSHDSRDRLAHGGTAAARPPAGHSRALSLGSRRIQNFFCRGSIDRSTRHFGCRAIVAVLRCAASAALSSSMRAVLAAASDRRPWRASGLPMPGRGRRRRRRAGRLRPAAHAMCRRPRTAPAFIAPICRTAEACAGVSRHGHPCSG
jgi:hypothetical protein